MLSAAGLVKPGSEKRPSRCTAKAVNRICTKRIFGVVANHSLLSE